MNLNYIEPFVYILWGAVAVLFVVFFRSKATQAITDVRTRSAATGSDSLSEIYLGLSAEVFFLLRCVSAFIGFVIGFLAVNVFAGAGLAALGFFIPVFMLKRVKRKRVRLIETQLVEGLELLGNSLKSGLTLQQAMEVLVREFPKPISQEFSLVLSEARLGVDLNDALVNMAERLESTIIHILATGIAITKRCGGDLTVIFANIAATIREQANIEGKLDAVTAQGRFQGLILSVMPFFLIIILWFVDRSHVETLFGYTIGIWALCLVVIMVMMAQLWINKLLAIDV